MSILEIVPDTKAYTHPHAITPHIWWVGHGAWGSVPQLTAPSDCNVYLLKGETFDVLIDSGGGAIDKLEEHVTAAGSDPSRVREIWLTHLHHDHFVGAGLWAKKYPNTICRISAVSIDYLSQKNYRLFSDLNGASMSLLHLPQHLLPLSGTSTFSCPPWKFTVEESPGHTPDGLAFRGQVDGLTVLFSGDTIIGDQNLNGPKKGLFGWIDGYWLSDIRQLHSSIVALAEKPADLILPGHGHPLAGEIAASSLQNCVARIKRLMASPDFADIGPYYMT